MHATLRVAHLALPIAFATLFHAPTARAEVDPATGIDFVTVGATGNAPWAGDGSPQDSAIGRGRVDYEYRIGKFEVTTAEWVEFFNAAGDRPLNDAIPFLNFPTFWSAFGVTPNSPGGVRFGISPQWANLPVGDITWRTAALYCNWLHNGKALNREAFLTGAYDVSTFGSSNGNRTFTDQLTRSPGAKYFIPSWDEWLKAAHYDPNKQNPNGTTGGWWKYSNASSSPYVYGPPGVLVNGMATNANAD
jgi:formylglycine-generating enzyme required for sulfatase activity